MAKPRALKALETELAAQRQRQRELEANIRDANVRAIASLADLLRFAVQNLMREEHLGLIAARLRGAVDVLEGKATTRKADPIPEICALIGSDFIRSSLRDGAAQITIAKVVRSHLAGFDKRFSELTPEQIVESNRRAPSLEGFLFSLSNKCDGPYGRDQIRQALRRRKSKVGLL